MVLHPHRVIRSFRSDLAPAADVARGPGRVRRRIVVGPGACGHAIVESVVILRTLAGLALRWELEEGERVTVRLDWICEGRRPVGAGAGTRSDPHRVELEKKVATSRSGESRHGAAGVAGPRLLFGTVERTVRWSLQDGEGDRRLQEREGGKRPGGTNAEEPAAPVNLEGVHVRCSFELRRGHPLTLFFALDGAGGREGKAVLSRVRDLQAAASGWTRYVRGRRKEILSLVGPESALEEGFARATLRQEGALVHPGGRRPGIPVLGYAPGSGAAYATGPRALPAMVAIALGYLATGRHESAGEVVDRALQILETRMAAVTDATSTGPGLADAFLEALSALVRVTGTYVLWSGDARPLVDRAAVLRHVCDVLRGFTHSASADSASTGSALASVRILADAEEGARRPHRARALRRWAASDPATDARSGETFPHPWSRWAGVDPDRIAALLVEELGGSAFGPGAGGEAAAGIPGPEDRSPDLLPDTEANALPPSLLVFGILGAGADVAYGRLQLAPRIPTEWPHFAVRGIRLGDSTVDLRYRRGGARHTFVLEPVGGRVPLNVVFEPVLPMHRVSGATVGGDPADVDVFEWTPDRAGTGSAGPSRPRSGVRLQFPLDGVREITVEAAEAAEESVDGR